MGINLNDLPFVIYAGFVLHNYCEACKETGDDSRVMPAMQFDQEYKPPPTQNNCYQTDCNEAEGK